jgi:predicted AAA+ superfamily ATPase
VRQALKVGDLLAFQTFLQLIATRSGQLLNLSQLGGDAGITHNTAKSWLGVLEASYLAVRLTPFHRNLGKRLVKTPKLHLLDSGIACYLLGIRNPEDLRLHPLRGAIFESWVVSEIIKAHQNVGQAPTLSFFRDAHGLEVDVLIERGTDVVGVEVKSGATVPLEMFAPLEAVAGLVPEMRTRIVVHGGAESFKTRSGRALSYREIDGFDWTSR